MNIVVFSINPLYPDLVTGGASSHLKDICLFLGINHKISVFCPRIPDSYIPFNWGENILVNPCLNFKMPFPYPYNITAYELADNIELLTKALGESDVFYIHDCQWLIPQMCTLTPTVIGIQDVVYPETNLGLFMLGYADEIITVSSYTSQYLISTVGRYFSNLDDRVSVIECGIDWDFFKKVAPSKELLSLLKLSNNDVSNKRFILHPHRPEATKGLEDTLNVFARLVHEYSFTDLQLLVPEWIPSMMSEGDLAFRNDMLKLIFELNLTDKVHFHPWIPQKLMPEYLSIGSLTLALGSFVEAFGKSVYESLGCETPCIYTKVSAHRHNLLNVLPGVDFGDYEQATWYAKEYLNGSIKLNESMLSLLKNRLELKQQVSLVAEVITKATKKPPLKIKVFKEEESIKDKYYKLAPWCYHSVKGIYHDYKCKFYNDTILNSLFQNFSYLPFKFTEIIKLGASASKVTEFCREGFIVPL
jgi:glycosyltransferase involved in cell wall biosynthesis